MSSRRLSDGMSTITHSYLLCIFASGAAVTRRHVFCSRPQTPKTITKCSSARGRVRFVSVGTAMMNRQCFQIYGATGAYIISLVTSNYTYYYRYIGMRDTLRDPWRCNTIITSRLVRATRQSIRDECHTAAHLF